MPGKRACRVKKLDRRSDLAVRQLADLPSHCPDALGPSGTGLCVGYSVRCGLDELDLEKAVLRHQLRVLRRGGGRPLFTTADRAFLGRLGSSPVPGPVEELPGRSGHPGEMAPGSAEQARARLAPAWSPSPRSFDQAPGTPARS